jgi:uncharacterized protein with HEPN domain
MKATRQHLLDILKAIQRIESYTEPGRDVFMANPMIQDAVTRNFEIVGEVVKRLPRDLLSLQPHIPWQDIAGFRDVLIHDDDEIDLSEVWLTVVRDVPSAPGSSGAAGQLARLV